MKFIKLSTDKLGVSDLISVMKDGEYVNKNVTFDTYVPEMRVRQSGRDENKIRITCEMKNTATKDNGFIVGTYFSGRFKEKNGVCTLRGHIATAPIYHLVLLLLVAFFVYRCITLGAFNPTPVILVVFDVFMFWREFKKRGIIERYIYRSFRRAHEKFHK